ncbi:metallophosphoesterase [soil metagenome]
MLTLAHLTDLHLGPLPRAESWLDYIGKRAIGAYSWHQRRRYVHDPAVAAAMTADIKAHKPDHVALTGDLINIALAQEFQAAAKWLRDFGPPDWISLVPGNHDAYRPFPWAKGAGLWADYMTGDMRIDGPRGATFATSFPYVRLRRNVALIGSTSAVPQALFRAGGHLGSPQISMIRGLLKDLRERGYYRVLLTHHPPLSGMTPSRRALDDAAELKDVLEAEGSELVLHGHNHRNMHTTLKSRFGTVNIFAPPSASTPEAGRDDPAAWNLYSIRRQDGDWHTGVTIRSWVAADKAFVSQKSFFL